MVKLIFKVNPYYLLSHSIEKAWDNKPFPLWVKLAKKIKSNPSFVLKNSGWAFTKIDNDKQLSRAFRKTENIFRTTLKTREFKRLLQETENYRTWVEEEWNKNSDQALRILKNITGIKFPDTVIRVFITHPKLSNGSNIPEEKIIHWGHPEEWKNYTIVYLCHELLHIMVHGKYKDEAVMHAIIELATDNELRMRLNKRGKYFKEKKYEVGHIGLRGLEKEILPIWKMYLRGELMVRNILGLEKILRGIH